MPSKSEWESQKDVIRELYLNQDYTLKALRARMSSTGFLATKSQFETKFKAWGFSKNDTNIPAAVWKHVGYKIAKRKRKDEDSTVFIDGIEVNHKRVKRAISRYTYSTIEQVKLESIGAPSPPGPLAVVATPSSSQQAYSINNWPENLPWPKFVASLNTRLANFHEVKNVSWAVHRELSNLSLRAQHGFSSPNDDKSICNVAWQESRHIVTRQERLSLIKTIFPYSYCGERVADIQNSMSLLSTTSSHWALKVLIYLASNNLLEPTDLDHIWWLVEETGIKELADFSKSSQLRETSLEAALEFLFEAGVWDYRTDIVSWLLDIGIDPNRRIRSQTIPGSHLPLVVTLLGLRDWRSAARKKMARLLLSKGASVSLRCCGEHNTATHVAIIRVRDDAKTMELFLEVSKKAQSHQLGSQYPKSAYQEDETKSDNWEPRQNQDAVSLMLEFLVDIVENYFDNESPLSKTAVSPETLIKAAESNNHRLIRIIHKRGLSMDCCDASQETPLIRSLESRGDFFKLSTVELLLELGASANYDPRSSRDGLCSRALQTVIHNYDAQFPAEAQAEAVKVLIRYDTEAAHWFNKNVPMILHDFGLPFPKTCLLDYMESTHAAFLEDAFDLDEELETLLPVLISETADLTLQSESGWTALDYALLLEMKEAGELMLEKGAVHSHKFIHDYCFSDRCQFDTLETLFRRVPSTRSDKQKRTLLFYRIIGTLRSGGLVGDTLAPGARDLIQEYRKLPRSRGHEAYIIRDACETGSVYFIGLVLELFPNTYSPAALEELICFQTRRGVDNWDFIEELLKRRLNASSPLHRLQDTRIFLHAVFGVLICKDNSRVLKWFHENSQEAFEFANFYPSAFLMNVIHSSTNWNIHLRNVPGGLKRLNMNQLYKHGLKTSAYLGLLAVSAGQVDQISDLIHHGMRPNRRFAWSLTLLQLAVAREDLAMSRRLLEAGADVNGRPPWRDIPESINLRIPHQICNVLTTDSSGGYTKRRSALQLAVEQGNLPMIMLLLENGADMNGPPARFSGATALQIACMNGYVDIAKLLIERGADVNGAGAEYFGRTALEGAAEHGRLDTVFLLLESGCLVQGSFRRQYIRAVGFARAQAHQTIAMELQDYGEWTNDDEAVLKSTDLCDIEPESLDLEEDLRHDEDVSEVDSEDLQLWRNPNLLPFEMDGESESKDYCSAADDEDATSSGQSTPKGILDEYGSSKRSPEPQDVRLDTWDDLLEYYGDDEGV